MDSLIDKTTALHCEELDDLEPDELNASKEYGLTLLVKIISSRKINSKAVQAILQKAWNPSKGMKIHSQQENIFRITMNHEWDRNRILESRLWSVMSSHVVVRDWPPHLSMDEIDFSQSPFWIRVSGLPPNLMTKSNAEKIGSKIGKVLEIDFTADGKIAWLRFLRIQVMLDITKPLFTGFTRLKDSISVSWTRLQYERLPDFCFTCGRMGHTNRGCPHLPLVLLANKSNPFGPWLRAEYSDPCPSTAFWNPAVLESWKGNSKRLSDLAGNSISDLPPEKTPPAIDGIPEKEIASSSLSPTTATTSKKPNKISLQPPNSEEKPREPTPPLLFPHVKAISPKEHILSSSNQPHQPDDTQTNQTETKHTDWTPKQTPLTKRKNTFDLPQNSKKVKVDQLPLSHVHPFLPCPPQLTVNLHLSEEIAVNTSPSIKGTGMEDLSLPSIHGWSMPHQRRWSDGGGCWTYLQNDIEECLSRT
ncbi:hypothetical protein RJ640_014108 [Escallonia rubra]|uniref:CCHC-type domain-containing protein n=1 Tax=Escallonia rubra TaxID=112253 RepID=A0AA88RM94_9ASTE|nr:hypothetical protein RJ640_014108 [Escallonia rubra]